MDFGHNINFVKYYPRKKPKNLFLSIVYRLGRLVPISPIKKFNLFSKFEWIFWRLAREQVSQLYPFNENPYSINTVNFLKKNINKEDVILDLGCGEGNISYLISKYCKKVIGIDYDKNLIFKAKKNYELRENLKFQVGKIPDIFYNNSDYYDLIICSHIIEHVNNYKDLLINLKKYTNKIFIEVPDFDSNDLNSHKKKFNIEPTYTDDDHIYEFDRDELELFFKIYGFKVIDVEFKNSVMRYIITH